MASIFLRGDMYWIAYRENSKTIRKSLKTKDKTVAKFKKNEIENKLAQGTSPLPAKIAISDAQRIYKEESAHRKTIKSINDDDTRLSAFVAKTRIFELSQIKEHVLSAYIKDRLENKEKGFKQISLTTANHMIKTVKAFLNFCVGRGLISTNAISAMKRYKVQKLPPRFLSKEEINKVLESCKDSFLHPMVMTAIYTGMRYGEISRIKWEDIDLDKNTITVPRSKSGRFRVIPIHTALKPVITKKNIPFRQMGNAVAIRSLQAQTGQKSLGWHTFRHTFASNLVMSGVDIVTVSKLLGHSRLETTMIYSHLSQGHIEESIRKLNF